MNFAELLGDVLNYSSSGIDISKPSEMFLNRRRLIFFCFRIFVFSRHTLSVFSSGSRPLLCSCVRRRVTDMYVHPCVGTDGEGRVKEVYKKLSG